MNSQNNDDDSMNFSVIEHNPEPQAAADFSVRSLLGEEEEPQFTKPTSAALNLHKSVEDVLSKLRNLKVSNSKSILKRDSESIKEEGNQFMRALAKMQKELSFQSTLYNVYEDNANTSTEIVPANKSKTYSCLKVTKEQTIKSTNKSTIREQMLNLNEYYGPLIIDFKKDAKYENKSSSRTRNVKNDSKTSNVSSQFSNGSKKVERKVTKSKSKDKIQHLFGRQNSKNAKYNLGIPDFRKSKSRSHNSKVCSSKSQSNLKLSSQAQNNSSSKVFTEYYGTDIYVSTQKTPPTKIMKKQKQKMTKVKSRQKSSSLKSRLTLLSPRNKKSTYTVKMK